MINHPFTHHQISEYVLDLLPASERLAFERHVLDCESCRSLVKEEQQLVQLVQTTVQSLPIPPAPELMKFMPPIPAAQVQVKPPTIFDELGRAFSALTHSWLQPMAALAVVVVLFFGSMSTFGGRYNDSFRAVAATSTAYAMPTSTATATMTMTAFPTATVVGSVSSDDVLDNGLTEMTPIPMATPLASLVDSQAAVQINNQPLLVPIPKPASRGKN